MKPTQVLHLVSKTFGGIESYVFNCYRYMDRTRFQFDFLTQNSRLKDAEQYKDLPYQVYLLRTTAAQDQERFAKQIREIMEKGQYDILHLHTSYWSGFIIEEIAREVGVRKVIVHSHNSSVEENDQQQRLLLLRQHEELKRAFTPDLATDFWACSQAAADWLFGPQIPREKIQIMKCGIKTGDYRFNGQKRSELRTALGIQNTFVLGTVGRLSYQKNQKFLIDVFAGFHRNYTNSTLLLLGDGERREEIELYIQKRRLESSVILLGRKNNVADYLQAMDCFLLPSLFEGLGIAVLEAIASGLQCIISENLPKELDFTDLIYRVPLDTALWIEIVEKVQKMTVDRESGWSLVRNAGYDVELQANVLEQEYEIR